MANADTEIAIAENMRTVLDQSDLSWEFIAFENEENVPSSAYPKGTIRYTDTDFDDTFGERPSWNEAIFEVRGWYRLKSQEEIMRKLITFTHTVRDALTIDALNIGALVASKLVSRVQVDDVVTDSTSNDITTITTTVSVRYREEFVGC